MPRELEKSKERPKEDVPAAGVLDDRLPPLRSGQSDGWGQRSG
jgi:hypothetical protein